MSFVAGGYDQQLQRNANEKSTTGHIVNGITTNIAKDITFLHHIVTQIVNGINMYHSN